LRLREIIRWNDTAGRTKAEILAVLDDAVSRAIMNGMQRAVTTSAEITSCRGDGDRPVVGRRQA
jgi:hypothetical protein